MPTPASQPDEQRFPRRCRGRACCCFLSVGSSVSVADRVLVELVGADLLPVRVRRERVVRPPDAAAGGSRPEAALVGRCSRGRRRARSRGSPCCSSPRRRRSRPAGSRSPSGRRASTSSRRSSSRRACREPACVALGDPVEGRACARDDPGRRSPSAGYVLPRRRHCSNRSALHRTTSAALFSPAASASTCLRDDPRPAERLPGEQDERQGDRGGQQEKRGRHDARACSCHRLSPCRVADSHAGATPHLHNGRPAGGARRRYMWP